MLNDPTRSFVPVCGFSHCARTRSLSAVSRTRIPTHTNHTHTHTHTHYRTHTHLDGQLSERLEPTVHAGERGGVEGGTTRRDVERECLVVAELGVGLHVGGGVVKYDIEREERRGLERRRLSNPQLALAQDDVAVPGKGPLEPLRGRVGCVVSRTLRWRAKLESERGQDLEGHGARRRCMRVPRPEAADGLTRGEGLIVGTRGEGAGERKEEDECGREAKGHC